MSSIIERGKQTESDQIPRLNEGIKHLMDLAAELGLDPFPIDFEIVPPTAMHSFAAYGLPEHYSHWTYGRAFRQQKTMYDYGLSRIYEMVVNSDPSQAYLLENNPAITNLMVAAHVIGHVDYFKHNYLFKPTPRDMPLLADARATRIREAEKLYGQARVEQFLDAILTLTGHIEPTRHYRPDKSDLLATWKREHEEKQKPRIPDQFDLAFPPGPEDTQPIVEKLRIPPKPDQDLLGFLRDFSVELEDWQRDFIDIVREESYYFYPQMKTKIGNEGYAVLVHKLLMHEMEKRGFLTDAEAESWWILHSGVARPSKEDLNPYWFGMMMWEYLIDYFNGTLDEKETEWCRENNWPLYPKYDGPVFGSPGFRKVREIMMVNDDVSLVRNYFHYIPATRMNAYLHETYGDDNDYTTFISTTDWVDIKEGLLRMMTNIRPVIEVVNADYRNRRELFLRHKFEGLELEIAYIEKTLPYVWKIWGFPVHLIAEIDQKPLRFDCEAIQVNRELPETEEIAYLFL